MKSLTKDIWYLLFTVSVLMSACVKDDSFFPDENTDTIVTSSAMATILNKFNSENMLPETEQCFRFVYPITLGYNTDAGIRVDSYDGLVDVISSQGTNFNITGLQFPITIIFNDGDAETSISDDVALLSVLEKCQFDTIRHEFDRFNNRCFTLEYPVTLFTTKGKEVVLKTEEEFQLFYQDQEADYQPIFEFPVAIKVTSDLNAVQVNTYFGFYRIFESCDQSCPQFDFTSNVINAFSLNYKFEGDFTDVGDVNLTGWFIDDVFIGDDISLLQEFDSPGFYNVCLQVTSNTCSETVSVCKEVEVSAVCPELAFDFENDLDPTVFVFNADFTGINDVTYEWIIDNEVQETDGGANGDNTYTQELNIGEHTVCIKATTSSCVDGVEFCEEVLVNENCPELFFTAEQDGSSNNYSFNANFANIGIINYEWKINEVIIEQDGGPDGDNVLLHLFDTGTYEICIMAETSTCPSVTEFCLGLEIQ